MIIGLTQMLKDDFGIDFKNTALLDEAFTHASYVNEHPREKLKYYERIEFLGDAVMQLCVSEYLLNAILLCQKENFHVCVQQWSVKIVSANLLRNVILMNISA